MPRKKKSMTPTEVATEYGGDDTSKAKAFGQSALQTCKNFQKMLLRATFANFLPNLFLEAY